MKLRELRKSKGITQSQVGEMLNVSQPQISQMENGKRKIELSEAFKLARLYKVNVKDLVD